MKSRILRLLPLLLIVLAIAAIFYFHLNTYLSFQSLKTHRQILLDWTQNHYVLAVLMYMFIYIISVTLSLPGAVFLTLAGGFLFGLWAGTVYVVVSATIGATCLFMIVEFSLGDWLSQKASRWTAKMQLGFQENAFLYLLILRLIPLFPFWVVNIVPGVLDVKRKIFVLATFLGIIPGSFVYVLVGNGLGQVFDANQTPHLNIIFEPYILLPIIGLAVLSAVPLIYKKIRKTKHDKPHTS